MTCNEGEIVRPSLTIHSQTLQRGLLHQGEMIYVPAGWASIVTPRGDKSITISEARMTSEAIEEAAAAFGEQEIHALKKALETSDWILWRRFTEILRQRKRAK